MYPKKINGGTLHVHAAALHSSKLVMITKLLNNDKSQIFVQPPNL